MYTNRHRVCVFTDNVKTNFLSGQSNPFFLLLFERSKVSDLWVVVKCRLLKHVGVGKLIYFLEKHVEVGLFYCGLGYRVPNVK